MSQGGVTASPGTRGGAAGSLCAPGWAQGIPRCPGMAVTGSLCGPGRALWGPWVPSTGVAGGRTSRVPWTPQGSATGIRVWRGPGVPREGLPRGPSTIRGLCPPQEGSHRALGRCPEGGLAWGPCVTPEGHGGSRGLWMLREGHGGRGGTSRVLQEGGLEEGLARGPSVPLEGNRAGQGTRGSVHPGQGSRGTGWPEVPLIPAGFSRGLSLLGSRGTAAPRGLSPDGCGGFAAPPLSPGL